MYSTNNKYNVHCVQVVSSPGQGRHLVARKDIKVRLAKSTIYGMARYGMVWYGMLWYGQARYGMVWPGMVWPGMTWYDMAKADTW